MLTPAQMMCCGTVECTDQAARSEAAAGPAALPGGGTNGCCSGTLGLARGRRCHIVSVPSALLVSTPSSCCVQLWGGKQAAYAGGVSPRLQACFTLWHSLSHKRAFACQEV